MAGLPASVQKALSKQAPPQGSSTIVWVSDDAGRGRKKVQGNSELAKQISEDHENVRNKQKVLSQLEAILDKKRHGDDNETRAHIDYFDPDMLWNSLLNAGGCVRLLSARWLVKYCKKANAVLPRRQDLPAQAFINPEELRRTFLLAPKMPFGRRAPIISVSQRWHGLGAKEDAGEPPAKEHPDPDGRVLQLIGRYLSDNFATFNDYGYRDVGVYMDWASCYQPPRQLVEVSLYKRSRGLTSLWFAHSLVTCVLCSEVPEDVRLRLTASLEYAEEAPFLARGVNALEHALAWLVKPPEEDDCDWPRVIELREAGGDVKRPPRVAPLHPLAFDEGGTHAELLFRTFDEQEACSTCWALAVEDVFREASELNYSNLGWGDEESARLEGVLPFCSRATKFALSGNAAATSLPHNFGALSGLRSLFLQNLVSLIELPESLGACHELRTLFLTGCLALERLPETMSGLTNLSDIDLGRCEALRALPECVGRLPSLQVLLLGGCSSLERLPERLPPLHALYLAGCTRLTNIPEGMSGTPPGLVLSPRVLREVGVAQQEMTLNVRVCSDYPMTELFLYGCESLPRLPATLGSLSSLQHIDLSYCSCLETLPKSIRALTQLEKLSMYKCSSVKYIPPLGTLQLLQELDSLTELPEGVIGLPELGLLNLEGCSLVPLNVRVTHTLPEARSIREMQRKQRNSLSLAR